MHSPQRPAPGIRVAFQPGADGEWLCSGSRLGLRQFPQLHLYDVVHEWWQLTEKPAVLAVWAARPEVATPELVADFSSSLAFGLAQLPEICAEASRELNLPGMYLWRSMKRLARKGLNGTRRTFFALQARSAALRRQSAQ
jgi:predicted solute-binding protein